MDPKISLEAMPSVEADAAFIPLPTILTDVIFLLLVMQAAK